MEVTSTPAISRPAGPDDGATLLQGGEGAAPVASDTPTLAPAPVPAIGPVGHLVGAERLAHLLDALAALEGGHSHRDVRILQYGDSHTAGDLGVAAFRHALQARFGDGGRGFEGSARASSPWRFLFQTG